MDICNVRKLIEMTRLSLQYSALTTDDIHDEKGGISVYVAIQKEWILVIRARKYLSKWGVIGRAGSIAFSTFRAENLPCAGFDYEILVIMRIDSF